MSDIPAGPTGLGSYTLSLRSALRPYRHAFQDDDGHQPPSYLGSGRRGGPSLAPLGYRERDWGDGTYPPLYCPEADRVNDELGAEVDRRLVAWAERIGLHEGRMAEFASTGFGRLAMLTHTDSDDPDMLLIAAQMNAAWWAADDYYADETDLGATPTELPPRLALVMSAMDPPPDAGPYTEQLEEAIRSDPVLVSLRSATSHAARHCTSAQVMRLCNITSQMYVSWDAYAAWRYLETPPPVWRYLAARQHDSFYTSMVLIDIVGGYELSPHLFAERRFHTALMQAGTAAVLVNDLHSAAKEAADELPDSNVVLLIAEEEGCSTREAVERTVCMHNEFVRGFEQSQRELSALPSPELKRFLRGAQAWMAGGVEWHGSTTRYQS
ncbi:terpene synthase [Nonomuraea sp. PA05]|uniref:family 2 encapsulin nanocompartment cargo protein terpene cyclase n=1 Tax=Nonomuraea sp. PA05 TaxID=2604466 RepID=UPI0011DB6226|nr:family 2 encapsulin nanocompartment cargo protein terpene cyclase [Nonomuraea sp. PA05]TYB64851.1 terpene synthase [Nonomuraea sp. PA05]